MSSNIFATHITRPSGVTATSTTLIDDIITNKYDDITNSVQGLFITGISDHFTMFHVAVQMGINESDVFLYIYIDKSL